MGKNWGRTPVTNADKRALTQTKYLVEVEGGTEERIDRRPLGKVERFVDTAGNIVSLQLYADGDAQRAQTEIRMRAQYHRKGLVEFSKCPVKHGTRNSSTTTEKDFRKMPSELASECRHDPKVMERSDGDLYARKSCPHIEWLIEQRRAAAADAYAKRNAHVAEAARKAKEKEKREALQAELLEKQLAEMEAKKPTARTKAPVTE